MAFNKTEYVYVSGKISYPKLVQPDQKFDCWSMRLYPDKDSLETLRDLQGRGLKNQLKKDEDGWYCTLRRPTKKQYKSILKVFEPPLIIDKDNQPFDGFKIGNTSDVTVKLEVYEYSAPGGGGKSIACRLETVKINDLVPRNDIEENLNAAQKRQLEGIKDQEYIF